MGMPQERCRRRLDQLQLDTERRLPRRQLRPVGDPEQMRVDRNRRLAKGRVEHDIGGLAPDPGQRLQARPVARYFAPKPLDQHLRQGDDMLRLGVEQPDRLDEAAHPFLTQLDHRQRCTCYREQLPCRNIYADVGCLRRQRHRDQQRVGRRPLQLAFGLWVKLGQPPVKFERIGLVHNAATTSAIE